MARKATAGSSQPVAVTDEDAASPMVEFGARGLRQFSGFVREEFLRELIGWRGIKVYREMRDNDPIISAMFFAVEMLLRGIPFTVEPVSQVPEDAEAAEFATSCLSDMEQSWPEFVSEVLTFLQYGYSVFEICLKVRGGESNDQLKNSAYDDGMIGWRKFAGRAQETVLHWEFDQSGDPVGFVQLLPTGGPLLRCPLAKCLHFRTRLLKNNPEAVSMLRGCYIPWYFGKRLMEIEAIGIERDLCGLPVAWIPARLLMADASADDKAQLEALKKMVRDTTRGQQEGFVMPLVYDDKGNALYKLELLSTGGRRQIDISPIIDRYDQRKLATMLADFITLGSSGSGVGSYAQSKNKTDLFSLAVAGFCDLICGEFNRKSIPDLLKINGLAGRCIMKHGDVSESNVADFAHSVAEVVTAGAVMPDQAIENAVRIRVGLPTIEGLPTDDLNEGGEAEAGGDVDDTTLPDNQNQTQGQGRNQEDGGTVRAPGYGKARRRK
jgi:hypothetical protein